MILPLFVVGIFCIFFLLAFIQDEAKKFRLQKSSKYSTGPVSQLKLDAITALCSIFCNGIVVLGLGSESVT